MYSNDSFEPCDGASSDHAWRSICVTVGDIKISGATWNMQMKCRSKINNGGHFPNNPLNIDESLANYHLRKRNQLKDLKAIMDKGNEFIFLQEPDWIFDKTLKAEYIAFLTQENWAMMATRKQHNCQPLVIFYKKDKLSPIENTDFGILPNENGKFRAFKVNFAVETSKGKQIIALVNLHLQYGIDYANTILELQKKYVEEDLACIMGGDTNNVQNINLKTMLGDWHKATNIEALDDGLSIYQIINGKEYVKFYDGFFVNPNKQNFAFIEDLGGKEFVQLPNGKVAYRDYIPTEFKFHQSAIAEPWMRQKHRAQPKASSNDAQDVNNNLKDISYYYPYGNCNRYHFFKINYTDTNGKIFIGDDAKQQILKQFLDEIKQFTNQEQFNDFCQNILNRSEYQLLKQGQGILTRIFGLKTDSLKALEKIIEDSSDNLRPLIPQ